VRMVESASAPVAGLVNRTAACPGESTPGRPSASSSSWATEPVQRLLHELLVPQPLQYFTETVRPIDPAAPPAPIAYLLGAEDIALPPGEFGWNPRFPQRLGVTAVETPGSHEACFTRSAELADAFLKA
jgi:hypothetical protein